MKLLNSIISYSICIYILSWELSLIRGQSQFNATTCSSKLISPRSDVAVAFDGIDSIYIFGGVFFTPDWNLLVYDEVHRFNITSDEIEVVSTLPRTAHGGRAHFRDDVGDILYLRADGTFLWSYNISSGVTTSVSEWLGSSAGAGLSYLPDKVIAFGGLDDATLVHTMELGTNAQFSSGTLPLKSELAVSLYAPEQNKTFIFAGELGNRTPVLMEYDHNLNITTILPWQFPSFRHGDGSPVLVPSSESSSTNYMYMLGAVINNGADGDHVLKVNLDSGEAEAIPLFGVPTELTTTAAVYVPSISRIYMVGGYDLQNEDKDSIWYIELE